MKKLLHFANCIFCCSKTILETKISNKIKNYF